MFPGNAGLLKSRGAPQSGLQSEVPAGFDVIDDPLPELDVYLGSNVPGDFPERARVQLGRAVVGVERLNAKSCYGNTAALTTARWPGTMIIRGAATFSRRNQSLHPRACLREDQSSGDALFRR